MSQIEICDICGKPLASVYNMSHYKIKKIIPGIIAFTPWTQIDAHDSCIELLLTNQKKNQRPPDTENGIQDN